MPELAFERFQPVPDRPEQASGRPLGGLGQPMRSLGGTYGQTYGTYVRDVQIPPVFYRTSSPPFPSGAAAQKGGKGARSVVTRGRGGSDEGGEVSGDEGAGRK